MDKLSKEGDGTVGGGGVSGAEGVSNAEAHAVMVGEMDFHGVGLDWFGLVWFGFDGGMIWKLK